MSSNRSERKDSSSRPGSTSDTEVKPTFGTQHKHSSSDSDRSTTETTIEKGLRHLENELIEKNSFLLLTESDTANHSLMTAAKFKTSGETKESNKLNIIVYNSHGLPAVMYLEHQHLKTNKDKFSEKFKFNLDRFSLAKEFKQKVSTGIPYTKDCRTEGLINDNSTEKKIDVRGATVIAPIYYENDLQLDTGQQEKKLKMYIQVFRNFSEHASMVFFYFGEYFNADTRQSPDQRNIAEQEQVELWMKKFGNIIIEDIKANKNKTINVIHRAIWIKTPEYITAQALSSELKKSESTYKTRYDALLATGNKAYFLPKHQNQFTPAPPNNSIATSTGKVGLLLKKSLEKNETKLPAPHTTIKLVRGVSGEMSLEINVIDTPSETAEETQAKATYIQGIFKGIFDIFINSSAENLRPKEQQVSCSGSPKMTLTSHDKENG